MSPLPFSPFAGLSLCYDSSVYFLAGVINPHCVTLLKYMNMYVDVYRQQMLNFFFLTS